MPYTYQAPGLYIEERSTGPRPIESVAPSVLAIVGFVPEKIAKLKLGEPEPKLEETPTEPTLVTNWTEFTETFGGLDKSTPNGFLHPAVYGYFLNGGNQVYIVPLRLPNGDWSHVTPDIFIGDDTKGIKALEAQEDVTILACPDVLAAYKKWKESGFGTKEESSDQAEQDAADKKLATVQKAMITHCRDMKNRIAILDMPEDLSYDDAAKWPSKMEFDDIYAAMYFPWIQVSNWQPLTANSPNTLFMPPSGHIAGVYARVDEERGIHKAPANEVIQGVLGLQKTVSRNHQEILNPLGVNCIRAFPGQGIRIWGARTLARDSAAQWRYINVRRLLCHIGDSIVQSTRWVVFEPNDQILWAAIRRDISAYLTRLWRQGALFGSTPEEAFYVKCDAETNPPDVIQAGYCIIEVGIAPVRPAEFVVIRIGQWEGGGGTIA